MVVFMFIFNVQAAEQGPSPAAWSSEEGRDGSACPEENGDACPFKRNWSIIVNRCHPPRTPLGPDPMTSGWALKSGE